MEGEIMASFYIIPKLNYYKPRTLKEALALINSLQNFKLIAGGTDLVVDLKTGRIKVENIIDISSLNELQYIKINEKEIKIGAATILQEIYENKALREEIPALTEAIESMGSWHVRNIATIGGNLCNASPAADTAPPLLILNAKLKLESIQGKRIVPIEKFFHGPRQTELKKNEILTEIVIPKPPKNTGMNFLKLGRRNAFTLSVVGVATLVSVKNRVFKDVRIALNAIAPTPIRAYKTESALKKQKVDLKIIEEKVKIVTKEIKPISDVRASAEYRKEMAIVLTRDSIIQSLRRIGLILEEKA